MHLQLDEAWVFTTSHADQLLVHTGHSTLTLADITEAMQRWYEDATFGAELPVLRDLRKATMNQSIDNLSAWGAHEWQHKVRIYHNDYEAAVAWLTSTIRQVRCSTDHTARTPSQGAQHERRSPDGAGTSLVRERFCQ